MPNYKLTEAAKKDLREIIAYTKKTWGKEQEKAYREIIRRTLGIIATNPEIGQKRDELAGSLRSFPIGHHIAYYTQRGAAVEFARILHPAMDRQKAIENERAHSQ